MPRGVLLSASCRVAPENVMFTAWPVDVPGGPPSVMVTLGSEELTLQVFDLGTLAELAAAVAEARDLLLTAALTAPALLTVDGSVPA